MSCLFRPARSMLPVAPLFGALALLLGLVACGGQSGPTGPPLPNAADLLSKSANAMSAVHTMAVNVQADPALRDLPVRSAIGKLTTGGDAVGTATLNQGQSTAEFNFTVVNGTLYLKGPTGPYQRWPMSMVSGVYDPTVLLRPDQGLPTLLRTATGGVTQAREEVNGVPTYRVQASFDPNLVGKLFPGLVGANNGTFWIDQTNFRLVKAQIAVPNSAGGPPAPVTVALSDFDRPVTVTPPA